MHRSNCKNYLVGFVNNDAVCYLCSIWQSCKFQKVIVSSCSCEAFVVDKSWLDVFFTQFSDVESKESANAISSISTVSFIIPYVNTYSQAGPKHITIWKRNCVVQGWICFTIIVVVFVVVGDIVYIYRYKTDCVQLEIFRWYMLLEDLATINIIYNTWKFKTFI